jgi:hypothetical protein
VPTPSQARSNHPLTQHLPEPRDDPRLDRGHAGIKLGHRAAPRRLGRRRAGRERVRAELLERPESAAHGGRGRVVGGQQGQQLLGHLADLIDLRWGLGLGLGPDAWRVGFGACHLAEPGGAAKVAHVRSRHGLRRPHKALAYTDEAPYAPTSSTRCCSCAARSSRHAGPSHRRPLPSAPAAQSCINAWHSCGRNGFGIDARGMLGAKGFPCAPSGAAVPGIDAGGTPSQALANVPPARCLTHMRPFLEKRASADEVRLHEAKRRAPKVKAAELGLRQ